MQADIFNWFSSNLGVAIAFLIILFVLLTAFYVKKYVRIFDPNIFYVHLRKGKAIKQGEGGMVVRIPFLDRILAVDRTVQQLSVVCSLQGEAEDQAKRSPSMASG
jgi:regulator of protease activity HflC (stomatin/prohibitin superfamily)